jgi:hypothetical protein
MISRFEAEMCKDHHGGKESSALDDINALAGEVELNRMKVFSFFRV